MQFRSPLSEQRILDARILIVDDEPANVFLLESALTKAGYGHVKGMTDSRQFAEVFHEFQPDLILLDLMMPYVDGFEILKAVPELTSKKPPPVIVITASTEREMRWKALGSGAMDFLTKPVDLMEVRLRARNILTMRLLYASLEASYAESERLLRNVLPESVAEELRERGTYRPVEYESASVLFADFTGFTSCTYEWALDQLIQELEVCFTYFDRVAGKNRLERLKTIGDGYMCAGGLPRANRTHPLDCVRAADEMIEFTNDRRLMHEASGRGYWSTRIGVHTGPVVAGVIGKERFAYDVWGMTVNTAKRIESAGRPDHIAVSEATFGFVRDHVVCSEVARVPLKGLPDQTVYFLEGKKEGPSKTA